MSQTSNLKSPALLNLSPNVWNSGDSNKNMGLIVNDVQSNAAYLDAMLTSTTTDSIVPNTSGGGTAIQTPVDTGEAFSSPVTLTVAQSGRLCISDTAAGTKWILPAATAANKGVTFKFYVSVTVTSNSLDVEGATSADLMVAGSNITQIKGTATPTVAYYSPNGSSNYKVTMNGTTTGGIIGDSFTVTCLGLNKWLVSGQTAASGSVATPFNG